MHNSKYINVFLMIIMIVSITLFSHQKVFSGMEEHKGLSVTVLLFSGRPDPVYTIEDKDTIERIIDLIRHSKEHYRFERPTVIPSILGYKGIVLENKAGITGIPAFIAVYKGNIETRNEMKKFLIDESNKLENLLLNEAIKKGVIEEQIIKRMIMER